MRVAFTALTDGRSRARSCTPLLVRRRMRTAWGIALLGLCTSACASPSPATPTSATSTAAPVVAPPGAQAPVVLVTADRITVDGREAASTIEIDRGARVQRIVPLFEAMVARRVAWKAGHPSTAFPGVASLVVGPETSGRAFASVFQTLAYAGYPHVRLAVGDGWVDTRAQVPGPPCGTPDAPCPSGDPVRLLHVQADAATWRMRVPHENGPLDARGEGASATAGAFRAQAQGLLETADVGGLIAHVDPGTPFGRLAPFLRELGAMGAALPGGVTVSIRPIDDVPSTAPAAPLAPDGSAVSGRLAPELIQRVIRARFGELRACYEARLRSDPDATGRTSTRFVIGTDGFVQDAQTTIEGALTEEVGACITGVFRKLTFPAPSNGIVTVTYPIVFVPG